MDEKVYDELMLADENCDERGQGAMTQTERRENGKACYGLTVMSVKEKSGVWEAGVEESGAEKTDARRD